MNKLSGPTAAFADPLPMNVTANDIERGQLRVTQAFKPLFPVHPGEVEIRFMEEPRRVRWHPNNREKPRSGTLSIKDIGEHLNPGDRVVAVSAGGLIEIRRVAEVN